MLKMMTLRIGVSLLLGGLIAGCNDGVELGKSSGSLNPIASDPVVADPLIVEPSTEPFLDPFAPGEPLVINDTEARRFIAADGNPTVVAASSTCVANEQPITPEFMTYTDGFFLDSVEDEQEGFDAVSVVRAKTNVDNRSTQFIEVCIESDGDREYFIETRVQGPSVVEDSYFFTVGDSEPVIYDVGRSNQNRLGIARDFVRSRDTDPLRVMLSDGRNTLRFFYRERHTALESVRAFRLPAAAPVVNVAEFDGEFSEAQLQCAANVGLTPNEMTALVEQHLPPGPVEYRLRDTNFNDASLTFFWRMIEGMRQTTPTVFCLNDPRPAATSNGLTETTNLIVGPFELPTLILGSDGDDRIVSRDFLDDQVVFYGFGGDDFVQWQVGGQFFGGKGSDTVEGLSAGFFDGGVGDLDVVKAATALANIVNAEVTVPNVVAPATVDNFELVGEDDAYTFLVLDETADERVITYLSPDRHIDGRPFSTFQINPILVYSPAFSNRGESIRNFSARSILTVVPATDDMSEVSLLSAPEFTLDYQLPTHDELIERFDGETLRGPEQIDFFQDATTADGTVRWLSGDTLAANELRPTEPVIEQQFADLSRTQSIDRQTLEAQSRGPIEGFCTMLVGDEIHIVIAQTPDGADVFAFDAESLLVRWRRTFDFTILRRSSEICEFFYLDQNDVLYVLNKNSDGALIETVRISPDNVESRLAHDESLEIFVNGDISLSGAYDGTTAVLRATLRDDTEFPVYGLLVQRFDDSQPSSEFVALNTNLDFPPELLARIDSAARPFLNNFASRSVTDGVSMWSVGFGTTQEIGSPQMASLRVAHGIRRIDLATGRVEALNVVEPSDVLHFGQVHPMRLSDGVIELGRAGRLIRFDADTLERLDDVKVVGNVVAFDADSVTTHLVDDDGSVRALRFTR